MTNTRTWVEIDGCNVASYHLLADALIAHDPHVDAWLDGVDVSLQLAGFCIGLDNDVQPFDDLAFGSTVADTTTPGGES